MFVKESWSRGDLKSSFRAAGAGVRLAVMAHKSALELGHQSESLDGLIPTSAAALRKAANNTVERNNRRRQQQVDDDFLLELLRLGDLDTYVAETIIMGMDDWEVSEMVSSIEEETGQDFATYARDILGAKMPDRRSSENEADFNRRVLILLADEMLNDDLSIKPEFADDPLAKIITESETYLETLEVVAKRNPAVTAEVKAQSKVVVAEPAGALVAKLGL